MSDIREHNEELDREFWDSFDEPAEPLQFEPDVNDVVDWLAEQDDIGEFLDDLDKRVRENKDATIYVMLADWLDEHYGEIKEFING